LKYALISVYKKEGIEEIAGTLKDKGYIIITTSGTREYLKEHGIETRNITDFTGFPQILDGRVKTLSPFIFAGILARRNVERDMATVSGAGIPLIDIVIVNLYPFSEHLEDNIDQLMEFIDIGGPSLVRAAAKNFKDVAVIVDPLDYPEFLRRVKEERINLEYKKYLALKAFEFVTEYDILIAKTMKRRFQLDTERLFLSLKKGLPLRYGENPHQKGWVYINEDERDTFLRTIEKLWGKELSYNNILDAYSAWKLLVELNSPACVIVKHNNPCGVAEGKTILEAYKKALEGDPVSAFGGIVALSEEVNPELAFELNNIFLEIVMAPSYPDEVLSILKKKKNRRLLIIPLKKGREKLEFRWVDGDFLVEEEDSAILEKETIRIVSGELTEELLEELVFAYKVVKHVRSNAIVVTKDRGTLGIGAGQMNRVQAVKIALENAGKKAEGAVLASDGFFPFTDSVELAHQYGIKAIIQPGGSVRDEEVIKKAQELNITMVLTGIRHFRH